MPESVGGVGSGPVSGAELLLVEEAQFAFNAAKSKKKSAESSIKVVEGMLENFSVLVKGENSEILALKTELNKARGFMRGIYESYAFLSKLVGKVEGEYSEAKRKLGAGVEVVQGHVDTIGVVANDEEDIDASGLHANIDDQIDELKDRIEYLEDFIMEVTSEVGKPEIENTFRGDQNRIEEELNFVMQVKDYIYALKNAMKKSGIALTDDVKLQAAINELENIEDVDEYISVRNEEYYKAKELLNKLKAEDPKKYKEELAKLPPPIIVENVTKEGMNAKNLLNFSSLKLRQSFRERRWDREIDDPELVITANTKIKESLRASTKAKVMANAALVHVDASDGTGITDGDQTSLDGFLHKYWEENVAAAIFAQDENTNQLLFDSSSGEYIVKVGERHKDFISQGAYVEMVNMLHSLEDLVKEGVENEHDGIFTKTEIQDFWGITALKKYEVTSPNGEKSVITERVRLNDRERAEVKKENIEAWEKDEGITSLKESFIDVELLNDRDFLRTVGLVSTQSRYLRNVAEGGALCEGLAKQALWTSNLALIFEEAKREMMNARKMGADKSIIVDRGGISEESTVGMQALRKAFDTWQKVGGFYHFFNLKSVLKQVTVPSEEVRGTIVRPSTSDLLFFEYASTGEATLNRQIGALGETMSRLNDYLGHLNKIDSMMSKGSLDVNHKGIMESSDFEDSDANALIEALNDLFDMYKVQADVWNDGALETPGKVGQLNDGQRQEVAVLLARASARLKNDVSPLDDDDRVKSLDDETEVKTELDNFGAIDGMSKGGHATANTLGAQYPDKGCFSDTFLPSSSDIKSRLHHLFNDEEFIASLGRAITYGQGVNDELKQTLKKTMFVYQEFIKSAGSIMEKISDMIKGMAQRVGR